MARGRCLLLLVALTAAACFVFPGSTTAQLTRGTGTSGGPVNVTVVVQGTVQLFVATQDPEVSKAKNANGRPTPPEVVYALVDGNSEQPTSNINATSWVRVDFGGHAAKLITGDVVQVPLTLHLTASHAAKLGLGVFNGRRLLSEQHERARRMVFNFQNSRRSVQEFMSLRSVLAALGVAARSQVVRAAAAPQVVTKNAKDLFIVDGVRQDMMTLTFAFRSTSCGLTSGLTGAGVRSLWYDKGNTAKWAATLQRYYNVCSYGQLTFLPETNWVYDLDIPCTGTTSIGPYNLKTGNGNGVNLDNELLALAEFATLYIKRANPSLFTLWHRLQRKIFLFPFDSKLTFGGLASLGCITDQPDCYTWLQSSNTSRRTTVMRAFRNLGHNIGLSTSARWSCEPDGVDCFFDDWGDPSCAMGYSVNTSPERNLLCPNAPQSYKTGWSKPIPDGNFNAFVGLRPGTTREFTLPATALSKNNFLRIVIDLNNTFIDDSTTQLQRSLFISYRMRQTDPGSYDSSLGSIMNGFVWIHEYNQTANGIPADMKSPPIALRALADKSMDLTDLPAELFGYGSFVKLLPRLGGLNITVKSKTASAAVVSACRFTSLSETGSAFTCSDGIDNDCDGLVDMEDPDCTPKPSPSSLAGAGPTKANGLKPATKKSPSPALMKKSPPRPGAKRSQPPPPATGKESSPPGGKTNIPPAKKKSAPPATTKGPAAVGRNLPPPAGKNGLPTPAAGKKSLPPPAGKKSLPPPAGKKGLPPPAGKQGLPPPAGTQGVPQRAGKRVLLPPPAGKKALLPPPAGKRGLPPPTGKRQSSPSPRKSTPGATKKGVPPPSKSG